MNVVAGGMSLQNRAELVWFTVEIWQILQNAHVNVFVPSLPLCIDIKFLIEYFTAVITT